MSSDKETSTAAEEVKMQMVVVNTPGSLVNDMYASAIVIACDTLMEKARLLWGKKSTPNIYLWSKEMTVDEATFHDTHFFYLADQPAKNHILPEHITSKKVRFVHTYPILANGGLILGTRDGETTTVAAALWQALVETFIEPTNAWWFDSCAHELVSAKVCDPVRSVPIPMFITLTRKGAEVPTPQETSSEPTESEKKEEGPAQSVIDVILCDFVLPAWRDPDAPDGSRLSFCNVLAHPFQAAPGGSVLKIDTTNTVAHYSFGRKMPLWMRQEKKTRLSHLSC